MAALDPKRNVELCVARIDRHPSTGWSYSSSTAPVLIGPLVETNDAEQAVGVLRAALLADKLAGTVLTPFPQGTVHVAFVTASHSISLGPSTVDSEGHFEVLAKGIESESWRTQRIALRLESPTGRIAQGFVSFPDFAYITQRAGSMLSRFFAILASNETPEDVAAIIGYFLENPGSFSRDNLPAGASRPAPQVADKNVRLSDLLAPPASHAGGPALPGGKDAVSWRRLMESVLACFREPRGPITDDPASDPSDKTSDEAADRDETERPVVRVNSADWPFHFVDRLLDRMLHSATSSKDVGDAFWMTHYVCDRIEPDAETVAGWLHRLHASFADHPPGEVDRAAVEVSLMVLAYATSSKPSLTRRRLLRIGTDLATQAPDISLVPGFARIVSPNIDVDSMWRSVMSATTVQEEIRTFRMEGASAKLDQSFPQLSTVPELKDLNDQRRKRLVFMLKLGKYCKYCNLWISDADRNHLHEVGVVRHSCGRILLCEEY